MDTNGDLNGTLNRTVTRSESSVSGTPRFITRMMPQKSFDFVCMVLAEILGTSTLLLMGCAGTVPWNGPPISIQPPLNFGLTVAMIVQMFGHVSYALLNPAVSIAAVVYNLITIKVSAEVPIWLVGCTVQHMNFPGGGVVERCSMHWSHFGLRPAQVFCARRYFCKRR